MNIFISLSVIFWSLFPSLISYSQGNELPEKIKLTNLVTNGDFSDGTTGWNPRLNSTQVVTNGINTVIASATNTTIGITSINTIVNTDYYYVRLNINSQSSNRVEVLDGGTGAFTGTITPNIWNTFSFIRKSTDSYIRIMQSLTIGQSYQVDDIILINLTATFGVANEPTKDYMDNLINEIGYFEADYYYSSSLDDNYKWFTTGFVDKTGERDFLDYFGFFVWLAVPPISIYLLYKLMKGLIYE